MNISVHVDCTRFLLVGYEDLLLAISWVHRACQIYHLLSAGFPHTGNVSQNWHLFNAQKNRVNVKIREHFGNLKIAFIKKKLSAWKCAHFMICYVWKLASKMNQNLPFGWKKVIFSGDVPKPSIFSFDTRNCLLWFVPFSAQRNSSRVIREFWTEKNCGNPEFGATFWAQYITNCPC